MKQPLELTMNIMELRHYANAKQNVKNATEDTELSEWDKYWVFEVEAELMKRRNAQRLARQIEQEFSE